MNFPKIYQAIKKVANSNIVSIFNTTVNTFVKALNASIVGAYFVTIAASQAPTVFNPNDESPLNEVFLYSFSFLPALRAAYVYLKRKYQNYHNQLDIDDEFLFNRNLATLYTYTITYDLLATFIQRNSTPQTNTIFPLLFLAAIPASLNRLNYKMPGRDQNPSRELPAWLNKIDLAKFKKQISYAKQIPQVISSGLVYGGVGKAILEVHYWGIYGRPIPINQQITWGVSFILFGLTAEASLLLFKTPLDELAEKLLNYNRSTKSTLNPDISRRIFGRFTIALKTAVAYTLGMFDLLGSLYGNTVQNPTLWIPSNSDIAVISLSSLYPAYLMQEELFRKRETRVNQVRDRIPITVENDTHQNSVYAILQESDPTPNQEETRSIDTALALDIFDDEAETSTSVGSTTRYGFFNHNPLLTHPASTSQDNLSINYSS